MGADLFIKAASTDADGQALERLLVDLFEATKVTLVELVQDYLSTIHPWFPILDQPTVDALLRCPMQSDCGAWTLVPLSLFLVTKRRCPDREHSMDNLLYRTLRQMFMLRAPMTQTLECLHAGLLLAYYSIGHAFARDAHVVLSMCVTIARMMGHELSLESTYASAPSEGSRCFWSILRPDRYDLSADMASRFVNTRIRRAVMMTSDMDPVPSVLLAPVEPSLSFEGLAALLSRPDQACKFELSSRVAFLVGGALSFVNEANRRIQTQSTSDYEGLCARMEPLVSMLVNMRNVHGDALTYCENAGLAIVTFLALQTSEAADHRMLAEEIRTRRAILLESTFNLVRDQLGATNTILSDAGGDAMPLIGMCSLSRATALAVRMGGENIPTEVLDDVRCSLKRFGDRWQVGGKT